MLRMSHLIGSMASWVCPTSSNLKCLEGLPVLGSYVVLLLFLHLPCLVHFSFTRKCQVVCYKKRHLHFLDMALSIFFIYQCSKFIRRFLCSCVENINECAVGVSIWRFNIFVLVVMYEDSEIFEIMVLNWWDWEFISRYQRQLQAL